MGESTQQAIEFYVKAGLDPGKENHEPSDHISFEMEFMYFLLFQYATKGDDDFKQLGQDFMNQHLSIWATKFAQKIIDTTQSDFYRELARLFDLFMVQERRLLTENL